MPRIPKKVAFPLLLLKAPFLIIVSLNRAGRSDALFVLPALAVIGFFAFVFVQIFARGEQIERRYAKVAQNAIADGNFELAKTYYQRIVADKDLEPWQKLQWAQILASTGEVQRADQLIKELAPEDGQIGYGPAHALKAIAIAKTLGNSDDPKILSKLEWHLNNTKEEYPEVIEAWSVLHLASEEYDQAIKQRNGLPANDGHVHGVGQNRRKHG